jgi:hypothetical protein
VVVRTATGPAIAAIHDERDAGTTHFFVMERRGDGYHVSTRGPLDMAGFRHAKWTAEILDSGDESNVLFTGTTSAPGFLQYRLVLLAPQARQTYSLRMEVDPRTRDLKRAAWSKMALLREAEPYRSVLRQRARALTGR